MAALMLLCGVVLFVAPAFHAQSPSVAPLSGATAGQAKPKSNATHRRVKPAAPAPVPTPVVEEKTAEVPPPDWPALAQANPAEVHFSGSDLTVVATNSSLQQIMHEISTATGVKVEGFSNDQRIFGHYGPAPAREVIDQLLNGTGYNVLMIGDRGQGTPRQLVLTFQGGGAVQPGQPANAQPNPNGDDDQAEEPEIQDPTPEPQNHPPFRNMPPGLPNGRSPQQMLQEQMQMRQQQQQQQPNQQPQ